MKLISISSGSSGNCYLVQSKEGHSVLIDCGLTARKTQQHLAEYGVNIAELSAIFLTHDHGDHLRGAGTISQRWSVPIYANSKTLEAAKYRWEKISRMELQKARYGGTIEDEDEGEISGAQPSPTAGRIRGVIKPPTSAELASKYNMRVLPTGEVARFGSLEVSSFPVSHDAADTVCYAIREDGRQATILTDLGCATEPIFEPLCNSDLIILEANHDLARLYGSRYPYSLKSRITGDRGHLSNTQSAEILAQVIERSSPAHTVWLAHLSEENNHPEIAKRDIGNHLAMKDIRKFPLYVAKRDKPSLEWNGEPILFQLQMF